MSQLFLHSFSNHPQVLIRWYDPNNETELPHRTLHPQAHIPVRMRMPHLAEELARLKATVPSLGLLSVARMAAARRGIMDSSAMPIAIVCSCFLLALL